MGADSDDHSAHRNDAAAWRGDHRDEADEEGDEAEEDGHHHSGKGGTGIDYDVDEDGTASSGGMDIDAIAARNARRLKTLLEVRMV